MELALEVRTSWGDSLLDASTLSPGAEGYFEGVRVVPELGEQGEFAIDVPERFGGSVARKSGPVALAPSMFPYTLGAREVLVADDGRIRIEMRYVKRADLRRPGFFDNLNYRYYNIWLIAFFVHAMLVAFASTPLGRVDLADLAHFRNTRTSNLIYRATKAQAPGPTLFALRANGPAPSGVIAKRLGTRDGRIDAKAALAAMFKDGTRSVFGTGGLGDSLENALGDVRGRNVDAGLGGMNTRGGGPGGEGFGGRSVGPGALTGVGISGDLGEGVGRTRMTKSSSELVVAPKGTISVEGSLPKEVIYAVIQEHIPQIRYCYEKELQRTPGLFGKVSTEFVIGTDGKVSSAAVASSTVKNRSLEQCMLGKIRSWTFPEPRGGGEVVVKYPFLFRPAG